MSETAGGVHYLHSMQVIHGDLKPENVRVTTAGQVKILDFGMGKIEDVGGCTTVFMPNPRYFAPELFKEDGIRPTYQSDIYSFGMLLLQILHGTDLDTDSGFDRSMPFNEVLTNSFAVFRLYQKVQEGRRPIQTRYNISKSQWEFLEECWHADPTRRPSIRQVIARLPRVIL